MLFRSFRAFMSFQLPVVPTFRLLSLSGRSSFQVVTALRFLPLSGCHHFQVVPAFRLFQLSGCPSFQAVLAFWSSQSLRFSVSSNHSSCNSLRHVAYSLRHHELHVLRRNRNILFFQDGDRIKLKNHRHMSETVLPF